jgi:hypothetical protein
MTPTDRRVDWNGVKECLAVLRRESEDYREKQALSLKRNQKNDHLHFATLKAYLRWEFTTFAGRYAAGSFDLNEEQDAVATLLDIKSRALEITRDEAVQKRLRDLLTASSDKAKILARLLA